MKTSPASLRARAAAIRILLLDVDGTLTDGRLIVGDDGGLHRAYNTQDGLGIKRLTASGVRVGIVTAALGDGVLVRAGQLGIARTHRGVADKRETVARILQEEKLSWREAAFMGDDLNDLEVLQSCGLACAPPGAVPEVLAAAHFVARRAGGMGAVREACDLILANQNPNQNRNPNPNPNQNRNRNPKGEK